MGTISLIIFAIILILLVTCSALFSFSEMAISSSNKTRLMSKIESKTISKRKKRQAKKVIYFIENYNEHITAIVIFNNIVNILFSTLATVFFTLVASDINSNGSDSLGPLMSFVITTPIVIVFGEIVPKQLAKKHPESGTMALSFAITTINFVMKPITLVLSKIIKEESHPTFSNDVEINIAMQEATKAGVTTHFEQNLIKKLLSTDNLDVKSIMVPIDEVVTIQKQITKTKLNSLLKKTPHTRFPVLNNEGKPIGVFLTKKYLLDKLKNQVGDMEEYMHSFTIFQSDENPFHILEALRNKREKMAFIYNESEKLIGIVTLEDIIEILVGEIYDEDDVKEDGVYPISSTSYILNPDVKLSHWITRYAKDVKFPTEIKKLTVSEWVEKILEAKPKHGDSLTYKNLIIWVRKETNKRLQRKGKEKKKRQE